MLRFNVRKSASLVDRHLGTGQVWVARAAGIEFVRDHEIELGDTVQTAVRWRVRWDDPWQWIECFWQTETALFIDDIMKLEAGQPVMFFVSDGTVAP